MTPPLAGTLIGQYNLILSDLLLYKDWETSYYYRKQTS